MLGNSELQVMKTESKPKMKKTQPIIHGVHPYFPLQRALMLTSVILTLRTENKITGTPNTTVWNSVSDTY